MYCIQQEHNTMDSMKSVPVTSIVSVLQVRIMLRGKLPMQYVSANEQPIKL